MTLKGVTIMLKKLVQNEYTALRAENKLRSSTLNKKNLDILRQVDARMLSYTWNCYEIERVKKDLIGMAAQAETRGGDLRQVMGGNPDEYCCQIVDGIDQGTPLDYICTWFPSWYLFFAFLNVIALVASKGKAEELLFHELTSPLLFLVWLWICAWLHRIGHRLCLRFGMWVELVWNILLLAGFVWLCIYSNKLFAAVPVQVSLWLVIPYQLALAAGAQWWQNVHYNRYARNHPWREQLQQ